MSLLHPLPVTSITLTSVVPIGPEQTLKRVIGLESERSLVSKALAIVLFDGLSVVHIGADGDYGVVWTLGAGPMIVLTATATSIRYVSTNFGEVVVSLAEADG